MLGLFLRTILLVPWPLHQSTLRRFQRECAASAPGLSLSVAWRTAKTLAAASFADIHRQSVARACITAALLLSVASPKGPRWDLADRAALFLCFVCQVVFLGVRLASGLSTTADPGDPRSQGVQELRLPGLSFPLRILVGLWVLPLHAKLNLAGELDVLVAVALLAGI